MTDPFSITVGCLTLIQLCGLAGQQAHSTWHDLSHAEEEIKQIKENLEEIQNLVEKIERLKHDTDTAEDWIKDILELERTSGVLNADWTYEPDPGGEPGGPLARLKKNMANLYAMVNRRGWKSHRFCTKLYYLWKKGDLISMLTDIRKSRSDIHHLLPIFQMELSKHILKTTKGVADVGQDTNAKTTEILRLAREREEGKRRDDERRRKDDEDKESGLIQQWLSPLDYQARQKYLWARSFPIGQWLLDSPTLTLWATGRPWYLHCYGEAGTGKVSCR